MVLVQSCLYCSYNCCSVNNTKALWINPKSYYSYVSYYRVVMHVVGDACLLQLGL